ncbi:MAG: isoprenoid biosynthesis glyoxalase ElbB [Planctomycetota bacterium]|nr:MAG: isoprenoid biosynthesis glyoxalase ElbB [Planctomycetota bacterium]
MARIAVCLSGCGFKDGAEIHESVLTLLALDQAGAEILCCAPNIQQVAVVNHLEMRPVEGEKRNVLVESARIARGDIVDMSIVQADDIDGLIFPGGFGAAQNLCSFASDGPACTVHPEVERLTGQMLDAKKPIGAVCIAPAMLARIVGKRNINPRLTIGNDKQTAAAVEKMGSQHVECESESCVVDETNRIVSTPAYMLADGPAQVFEGIQRLVNEVLRLSQA